MTGLNVVCPGCRKVYHETTDAYDPDKPANGSMVHLKDPWRKWGWCSFGDALNGIPPNIAERPETYWSVMECPGCGTPLAPGGRLLVKGNGTHSDASEIISNDAQSIEFICQVCGKACKSPLGLSSHMRSHG